MPSFFLTAFGPYGRWEKNASWLALVELTRTLPPEWDVTTRLYPVEYEAAQARLAEDLAVGYDFAIHLGQAPGSAQLQLESIGLNLRGGDGPAERLEPLVPGGPVAYQTTLPTDRLADAIRREGIPASVSFHAGTFLCNGLLYLSHHLIATRRLRTRSLFIHVPLDCGQAAELKESPPSLPFPLTAHAVRVVLETLADET